MPKEEKIGADLLNEMTERWRDRGRQFVGGVIQRMQGTALPPSTPPPPLGGNSSFRLGSGHLRGGPRENGTRPVGETPGPTAAGYSGHIAGSVVKQRPLTTPETF